MTKTIIIKIQDMRCASCAMNIDGALEDTQGVISVNTNYAKGESQVEYDPAYVGLEKLLQVIKGVGYGAELKII